jgi:outer membrane protein TolC
VDNAKAELIRTESLIRIAKGDLNAVMGLSAEMPVEIDVHGADPEVVSDPNIPTLLEQAIQTRPEIKAAKSAVASARQQIQAAKGDFGPKVYADGSYGWRDNSPALAEEVWSAGITVELTAFEGFSSQHKLNRTRAELSKAEVGLEQVSLAVRKDVWAACARVQEAKELIQATLTQVRDAKESLRLMAARYTTGSVTFSDLLDAQTAFTAASARQVQARWSYQQAQSALQRATGTLMVDP